jgi:hypothetical protein
VKLNDAELEELNILLCDKKIDIPEVRRSVTASGNNYQWLQRNIMIRNPNISDRLKNLLGMKVMNN